MLLGATLFIVEEDASNDGNGSTGSLVRHTINLKDIGLRPKSFKLMWISLCQNVGKCETTALR